MESAEIIKSINDIYRRFKVPRNLQEHMRRAAAVGDLICDKWQGPGLHKDDIIATLLLHDLGNIIKMDLESERGLRLLGADRRRTEEIKEIQREIMEKYGPDDHIATHAMAEEIGASTRVLELLDLKTFSSITKIVANNDFENKICAYADLRVGPLGILMLKERFGELRHRLPADRLNDRYPNFEELVVTAQQIEAHIFEHLLISPEEINDFTIELYLEKRLMGL